MAFMRKASLVVAAVALVAVAGCSTLKMGGSNGPTVFQTQEEGGFNPFRRKSAVAAEAGSQIGVNSYLWRASLDTLSFIPLASADPWGGVIITDWYTSPEKPDERFKVTVYILDTRLRADGLNVAVFKQVKDASGAWADSATAAQTETDLENAILTRARQLRLSTINGKG
ncbi:MAG: hypothetical protein RJA87_582 [Pseudomonadota bacterium]|jgi:hypothetical protein